MSTLSYLRRRLGLVLLLALLAALVTLHFLGLDERFWPVLKDNHAALEAWVQDHFALAVLLFFLVYVVVIGLSIPVAVLFSLAAGALFGRWWGTLITSFASTSGATVAFLVSRYLLRDTVRRWLGERLEAFDRGLERDGAYYLISLRLVALVPFWLINLGMGLTRLPLRTYWWASQLGMLPATFLFVNAGTKLGELESPRGILTPDVLVSLGLLALFPLAVRAVHRRLR
jgi:uncharacterized membrane protein YdjX (TVP38/TMEM64 family)